MLNLSYKDIIRTFDNLKVFRLQGEFLPSISDISPSNCYFS